MTRTGGDTRYITNPRQHLCNFGLEFYAIYFFGTAGLVFLLLIKQDNFSVVPMGLGGSGMSDSELDLSTS
ncbi:hypothetical protein V6N12_057319 [Hibiscus sabdariffa]|uniref:Uncharacterized protein n=1 Tax=Hibiscus sabdariffa TaxID=183260 RepID=A0ABR2DBI3_9ROSI